MKITRLVTDLVDFGALQSGAFRMHFGPVVLAELIESCVKELEPEAKSKGLSLDWAVEVGLPKVIQTDGPRLRQALLILLGNGVKFTREGGVSVRARKGRAECCHADQSQGFAFVGACLEIAIKDSGPGLTPEDQKKVLRLFSRLESVPKGFGSGLSLALAARLCVAMGGSLQVLSDGHSGSTFIVRLPLGLPAEIPEAAEEAMAPAMGSFHASRSKS